MSKNVTVSNGILDVVISTFGAEIKSLKKDGKEYLWGGNPDVWSGQAPILFPMCGAFKDNKYTFEGKTYTLPKHGFARTSEFEIETAQKEKAVFLLKANDETLKNYPFDFELRAIFELSGSTLNVSYEVKNKGGSTMYFSVGAHEAYDCPEGIEEYSVIFEKDESFDSNVLYGELLGHETIKLDGQGRELPLKYEYFAIDAQVFTTLKSRKATLKNRKSGKSIDVSFADADYFLLWTKPTGKYICFEPWSGIQDYVDTDGDITHKPGIIALTAGETSVKKHSITIN